MTNAHRLNGRDNIDGTVQLGSWTEGVVNSLPAKSVPNSGLVDAVNVDIDNKGKVSRRKGFTKILDVGQQISRIAKLGSYLIFSKAGTLNWLDSVSGQNGVVDGGNGYGKCGQDVCFLELDDKLYFSSKNSSTSGVVTIEDHVFKVRDFGVPCIPLEPTITRVAGTLPAGTYLVACTLENDLGEEGGSSQPRSITVPDGSAISLHFGIDFNPFVKAYGNAKLNVYVSDANSETLFRHTKYTNNGSSSFTIKLDKIIDKGAMMRSGLINPMPFVSKLAYCNGRIYGADGNVIFYSEPFRYGLVEFQSNYFILNGECKLLAAVQDGLYLADSMTYFVDCSTVDQVAQRRTVLPYSAVTGTECKMQNEPSVSWMSSKGVVIGSPGGLVKNVQDPRFIVNDFGSGAMVHKILNGQSQLIASMIDMNENNAAFGDFADAEIRRAGTF